MPKNWKQRSNNGFARCKRYTRTGICTSAPDWRNGRYYDFIGRRRGINVIGLNDDDGDADDDTSGDGDDIGRAERAALADDTYMPTRDEDNLRQARMDNVDFEGDPLNEGSFGELQTESDLDVPGSRDETLTESMGQGDEENKGYSVSDTEENESSENRTGA
jgi:hypothetical protein